MKKTFTLFVLSLCFGSLKAQSPDCTTNISPENAATNVSPAPFITLKWFPVAGAIYYNVYLNAKLPPTKITGTAITDTFNIYNAQYNSIYYWYIVPVNSNGAAIGCGIYSSSFTTSPLPVTPVNDNCDGAIDVSNTINGSTFGASQSQPADACGGYTGFADDDVWYQFTALSTGTVSIDLASSANFDGVLELFKGNCGSLMSVACSDDNPEGGSESITVNAVAGTNYKVRVYSFGPGLSDRGGFTITAVGSALPISLLSFKGEHVGNNNVLNWSTATEINNQGFELQYSFNGKDFKKLAFVNSQEKSGNSSSVLNYKYVDNEGVGGTVYYRLMQVDKDGRYNYSNIVLIKGDKVNTLSLNAVYPNPAKDNLTLIVSSPTNGSIHLVISDLAGKVVQRGIFSVMDGGNNLDLNVNSLSAGTYFIKAFDSNGSHAPVIKFVKE